jgi:hypothetical protein
VQQPVDLPVRTLYAPDRPVNLAQTLSHLRRGTADPTFRTDASGTWRTQRTPQGAATLHLVAEVGGVRATA